MELEDSLYPLLREVSLSLDNLSCLPSLEAHDPLSFVQVSIGIDPQEVFVDADWALLIGAKPRGPGMERSDLLDINGRIFVDQVLLPSSHPAHIAPYLSAENTIPVDVR